MIYAVTGGAGFVGGALIDALLDQGAEVRALIRNRAKITDRDGLTIIEGDLHNKQALDAVCQGAAVLFHLAGVTFPRDDADYARINIDGAANASAAAAKAGAKFVHASSMSARHPEVSPYAKSKNLSESAVAAAAGDNAWIALRLPAIYGPRDEATLPVFKLVKAGLALAPKTTPPARASIIYIDDAAAALIAAAASDLSGTVYEVGDETEAGRSWGEINETLGNIMNKKVTALAVPKQIVSLFHTVTRSIERARGQTPTIRTDQANEFYFPDWVAHAPRFNEAAGWDPKVPLSTGFAKTVRWYRDNALL